MGLADSKLFGMGSPGWPPERMIRGEVSDLLASPLRRCIVRYLLQEDPPGHRIGLATQIAENEPVDITPLWIALTHSHLPRLADAGVIKFDVERGTIVLIQEEEPMERLLDVIDERGEMDRCQAMTHAPSR